MGWSLGSHSFSSSPSHFATTPFQNKLALTQRVWAPPTEVFPLFQPPQNTHTRGERALGGVGADLCLGDPADPECSCQELGAPLETPHGAVRAILLLLTLQLPSLSLSLLPPPPCHSLAQLQGHREAQPKLVSAYFFSP